LLAISATFTAEPLAEALGFWLEELRLPYKLKFAGYNQVFQQLLDPSSLLATNRGGINVVLVRFEDWTRFHKNATVEMLDENAHRLASALASAAHSFASPVLVCICPSSPAFLSDSSIAAAAHRIERWLVDQLREFKTILVSTPTELDELYPVDNPHDPHADQLGHIPYTTAFFTALATLIARKIHAMRMLPYKVIVLDCDETLWKGICGEDGPEGVSLDPPRRALQEFMLAQHQAGMLLCLCSKNNEEDVLETFRLHSEMPLRLEHFVARRINWEPKSANLRELAEELQLGLDTFIFVDDHPQECAEVQANRPEVLSLCLPSPAELIPGFLKHIWAFDHIKTTEEDRQRTQLYMQQIERAKLEKQSSSFAEFIASLALDIRISPMKLEQLSRVAQLTQRTNQMNASLIRRSEADIQSLLKEPNTECLTVEVTDRFGSYGLTGVVIYQTEAAALKVDTFLLSCRVLGRGVEHRVLARLGEIACSKGLSRLDVPFIPGQRNRPALLFLESVGAQYKEADGAGWIFRFPAEYASKISYQPDRTPAAEQPETRQESLALETPPRDIVDYVLIAREFNTPQKVIEHLRLRNHEAPVRSSPFIAPRNALERQLAEMWAELLHLPSVGIYDNFFDLGGHSLLAVQLLSRVREAFHVDLSLEVVYSHAFTVAELAKAIELREIEQAGADQYADLLKELEGLSDEEVKRLLAEEDAAAKAENPG